MLTNDFHKRCENLAIYYRHELGLQGYDPLLASKLATFCNVIVNVPSDLGEGDFVDKALKSDGWRGLMVIDDMTGINRIIYNPKHSEVVCEESIMHELAHYILGHKLEKLGAISTRFASRFYPKLKETEANLLTDYLKFPEIAKKYAQQLGMSQEEIISHYCITHSLLRRQR